MGYVGWNGTYTVGGNYWSSYVGVDVKSGPYQNLTGSDGIGDTAYYLGTSTLGEAGPFFDYSDNYSMMQAINRVDPDQIPESPSFLIPLLFMIATLLVVTICKRECHGFLKGYVGRKEEAVDIIKKTK